ncbi:MAG: ATP-binding protein [Candidatus Thermoplasmatota archaeon]|nr:ATP-binding protein [Candidatus Thermoplasmatota archaeon]
MKYLIITCGVIGTGKSTIAKALAKRTGMKVISSDYVRKSIVAGIPPETHRYEKFGEGIYSKEFSERTYLKMLELAKVQLTRNKSVILDGAFSKRWQRVKAYETAKETDARFLCVEFICSKEELIKRLEKRALSKRGVSNGRIEILAEHEASFEKVSEFSEELHIIIDTTCRKEDSVQSVLARLNEKLKLKHCY